MRTEAEIQEEILWWLTKENILHFRMETTGIPIQCNGKLILTKNKGRKGMADILCQHEGLAVWIEVKSETGKQSPEQMIFEEKITKDGGIYLLARDLQCVEDLFEFLRANPSEHWLD